MGRSDGGMGGGGGGGLRKGYFRDAKFKIFSQGACPQNPPR